MALRGGVLEAVVSSAGRDPFADLTSLLVARNGCLALEAYFNGSERETLHDVRSIAKSITGTLVGIALHEQVIASLDTPMLVFFPTYAGDVAASGKVGIRVRDLLEMRSGLDADDWNESPESRGTEARMEAVEDWLDFALHVPMAAAPGARWQYSSVNTVLLGRIVESATHRDLEAYAREKLFEPLGFGRHEWRRDKSGHVVAQGNLSIRARDLLAFGLLLENAGRWHGRQLVPPGWIAEATRARTALPTDAATGLGDLYQGYADHWWTSEESTPVGRVSVYFASGNGGQKLFIAPRLQRVVALTSSAYGQSRAHRRAHDLLRSILAAVVLESAPRGRCHERATCTQ